MRIKRDNFGESASLRRSHVAFAGREKQVGFQSVLTRVKVEVAPTQRKQLRMVTALHDPSLLNYQNLVSAPNGRKPVSDHERRSPLHQLVQPRLNHRLRFGVERARGLVENQNSRLCQQSTRD